MEGFIDVDSAALEKFFEDAKGALKKPVAQWIRERSGALARYFAEATQPVAGLSDPDNPQPDGISKAAKQLGQAAVRRDISRVYSSPSSTYKVLREQHGEQAAKAFYAMLKVGDIEGARNLLRSLGVLSQRGDIMDWDGGARHQQMRNSRGRVNTSVKPVVVRDRKSLADYMRLIIKRVGWAKSGWIKAASMIPGAKGFKQVPVWMKQPPAPGTGTDKTNDEENPSVLLRNDVKYIGDLMDERSVQRAQKSFEESLQKELDHILAKQAEKDRELVTTGQ